jgi:hypothetical protein
MAFLHPDIFPNEAQPTHFILATFMGNEGAGKYPYLLQVHRTIPCSISASSLIITEALPPLKNSVVLFKLCVLLQIELQVKISGGQKDNHLSKYGRPALRNDSLGLPLISTPIRLDTHHLSLPLPLQRRGRSTSTWS